MSKPVVIDPKLDLGCRHCGRVVLAGGPCCRGMALDMYEYSKTVQYQTYLRENRRLGALAKAQRKEAKRQRRLDNLARRAYDAQDQARMEASAWEGMIDRRE